MKLFLLISICLTARKLTSLERILFLSHFLLYHLGVLGNSSIRLHERAIPDDWLILLLPLIAGGIVWMCDRVQTDWNRANTALVILAIALIGLLPRTLENGVIPRNTEDLGLKKAGQWIKEQTVDRSTQIVSTTKKIPYYADVGKDQMEHIRDIPGETLDQVLQNSSAEYLAYSEKTIDSYPVLDQAHGHPGLTHLYIYGTGNERINTTYVFRMRKK